MAKKASKVVKKKEPSNGEEKEKAQAQVAVLEPPKAEEKKESPKASNRPDPSIEERIKNSKENLKVVLSPDQKFFESPDGEIIVGEAKSDRIWSRTMHKGKGGWANPMRLGPTRVA